MKNLALIVLITAQFAIISKVSSQNVSINTTGNAADASAMLDITSNAKGLLIPRMTQAERAAISGPANSLLVYQTDGSRGFYYYSTFSSSWTLLASSGGSIVSLNGLSDVSQSFAVPGTAGTAPGWVSAASVHTLNIPLSSVTGVTAGLLSNTDWNTFNNKASSSNVITSLNGLTATVQTFATGTTGTDFTIASSGSAHTFNLPNASATARGLVTTGAQTIAGSKTFSSAPTFSTLTAGSVPYIGTGGLLAENNAKLFWDAANSRLGIGTNAPVADLTLLQSSGTGNTKGFRLTGNSIGNGNGGTGFTVALGYNVAGNKQLWLGDPDYLGNAAGSFIRYSANGTALPSLDGIAGDGITRRYVAIGVQNDANSGVIFGNDGSATNPGSQVWDNGNMAIGSGYRASVAPAGGLIVQGKVGIGTNAPATALQVSATADPLTLLGVSTGTNTSADSLLTITSGLVRKLPLSTFASSGNAISSLNGLTATTQTFATGTSGTDFNIASSGSLHTFNIPDASSTARGMVTTVAQTIAGSKTFSSAPTFSTFTSGSVPFIGTAGLLSQNNTNFFWDATNSRLGIGTNAPAQKLDVNGTIISSSTSYPNYAYNSANRMAFGETNVPVNETGSVVQYGSGSNTRNMLFAFTKTNVNTSFLGNDGTQMMLGTEANAPITFRTGLTYSAANIMASGAEVMRITNTGRVGIGTTTPATALHVTAGADPLTLLGVSTGTNTTADSLLTITNGLVRKLPLSTFASSTNAISSLNGLTATTQTFATPGTSGTAPAWNSAISAHTLNIPLASAGSVTAGLLSNTDYTAFNTKQPQLNGTGFVKVSGTTISYDNSAYLTGNQSITFTSTGDVTGSASGTTSLTPALTIATGAVTNAKLATMPANTLKANNTGAVATAADITGTQATAMLDVFTSGAKGLVPASAGGTVNFLRADGTFAVPSGTTSGTVTSVSGTNGVTVATGTTTPVIGLGAVTPSSVTASGTVAGSNLSGTNTGDETLATIKSKLGITTLSGSNTGDQTITLTGNVTGSGTGSFATTIAANAVTYAKMQSVSATSKLLGSSSTTTPVQELTIGSGLSLSGTTLTASGSGGTVTSVSVAAANGVSGSVATSTTTPAITLTLGAITPASVAAAGTVSGSNLSGTNTGDETQATIKTKLGPATTNSDGYLTLADWNTFNSKASTTNSWSTTGNAGTTTANFIGTTDANGFRVKVNTTAIQGLLVDSLGNAAVGNAPVFAAGNSREKFLVDAGSTLANPTPDGAFNLIGARGYLDSYLQLNVQNLSPGVGASSDIVASNDGASETTNFIDMGINSSANTSTGAIGGAGTAYLYSTGNDLAIGNGTANKSVVFFTGGLTPATYTERIRLDASGRVGIGTNNPGADLTLFQSAGTGPSRGLRFTGNAISGPSTGTGFAMSLGYNVTNNKQLWLGDADYLTNNTSAFLRFSTSGGYTILDAVAGDNGGRRPIVVGLADGADPSKIVFGADNTTVAPSSFIWANGNMSIGNGYKANAAPANGLLVQGKVGFGVTAPTADLHISAGSTAANSAPLKFTSGTNMTTPETGAVEFDGTNYFVTNTVTRYTLAKTITNTAPLDFAVVAANSSQSLTMTLTGATDGDAISLGVPNAVVLANTFFHAYVSATNTVTIRFINNNTTATADPVSATFRVSILKY